MSSTGFNYYHRVAFHETDNMGVVHHSNYIKYFEEARVAWLRERDLMRMHIPKGPYVFAVIEADCRYLRPGRFDDELITRVEGIVKGMRLTFRYATWSSDRKEWLATGTTILVPLTATELRPARLPEAIKEKFANAPFSSAWPPSPPED